tara:strand:- start:16 stop:1158 length:1143 start_codon:yes stop_codon:yes gene_type:complete
MKIIICFYASNSYGSEYRSGYEFLKYADSKLFDLAIISDIEFNKKIDKDEFKNLKIKFIPQDAKDQNELYKNSDFKYCKKWLAMVKSELSKYNSIEILWICNPAQIWHPIYTFLGITNKLIWGPIGGGESIVKISSLKYLKKRIILREFIRSFCQYYFLILLKFYLIIFFKKRKPIILSRTKLSEKLVDNFLNVKAIFISERMEPLKKEYIIKETAEYPEFIWIGQDIPRKNLNLTKTIFRKYLSKEYNCSKLTIIGAKGNEYNPKIIYKSWVKKVPYEEFKSNGILICTSLREGMPSVIIEALNNGLFVLSNNVGSVNSLQNNESIHIFESSDHTKENWEVIYNKINRHLEKKSIILKNPNFIKKLDNLFAKITKNIEQ